MKALSVSLFATAVLLAGCGSKNDANEKNFARTVSARLDSSGLLCITPTPAGRAMTFPAVYPNSWLGNPAEPSTAPLKSLEDAGLLEQSTGPGLFLTAPGRIYSPTPAGKKLATQLPFDPNNIALSVNRENVYAFCYGKLSLNKIVDWTSPDLRTHESAVRFTYNVTLNEPWASNAPLLARFPEIANMQRAAGSDVVRVMMVQTEDGWRYEFN